LTPQSSKEKIPKEAETEADLKETFLIFSDLRHIPSMLTHSSYHEPDPIGCVDSRLSLMREGQGDCRQEGSVRRMRSDTGDTVSAVEDTKHALFVYRH
jgi:hypothetical protein